MINNNIPHNKAIEESIIASCLTSGSALDHVLSTCIIEDFYIPSNKTIFKKIKYLYDHSIAVDRITVSNELKFPKMIEVLEIILNNADYNYGNIESYCNILLEKARLRTALRASDYIQASMRVSEDIDADIVLEEAQNILFTAYNRESEDTIVTPSEIFDETFQIIKAKMYNKDTNIIGLSSSIKQFDTIFYGLEPGHLTLLAGRPSMGKTEFAIQMAIHNALAGKTMAFFSLEQPRQELMERIIAHITGISAHKIKHGFLGRNEVKLLEAYSNKLKSLPLVIDDNPSLSLTKLIAKIRKIKREYPDLEAVFIDYIQLMEYPGHDDNKELGIISRALKLQARKINISIIPLSQLNRDCEKRDNKKPLISDLRGSGSLEQDADKIIFMYSDYPYTKKDEDLYTGEIILAKHRNGAVGNVLLTNNKIIQKFYAREDMDPTQISYTNAIMAEIPETKKEEDDLPF